MPEIRVRPLTNPSGMCTPHFPPNVFLLISETTPELDVAAAVLATAFEPDSFTRALIGGDQNFGIPFQRATIAAAVVGGEPYVASYGDVDIAGVAVWFGPGNALFRTPEQDEVGFDELFASYPPELTKWWMEYFLPKYETTTTSALGEGGKLATWHLQVIGVLPEYQHKGIGSALIKVVEEKAFQAGKAMCLETETDENVPMYEHWGFTMKGKDMYESPTGGFPMYVMFKGPDTTS